MSICSNIIGMFSATADLHVLLFWYYFQAGLPAEKAFRCCWQMEPAPWSLCARGLLKRCTAFCIAKQIKRSFLRRGNKRFLFFGGLGIDLLLLQIMMDNPNVRGRSRPRIHKRSFP